MDQALGLRLGRGLYERAANPANVKLIKRAVFQILEGKPFQIVAELNGKGEKEFRRLWNLYKAQAMDEIVKEEIPRLDLSDEEKP